MIYTIKPVKLKERTNVNKDELDLKAIEKKAYRSTFQDGIWDIYIGVLLLGFPLSTIGTLFGLGSLISMIFIIPLFYAIAIVFLILGKKKITVPRIGHVKFGPKRQKRKKELVVFLSLLFILNIVIFVLTNLRVVEIGGLLIINIIIIVVPLGIVAYLLDFRRLYLIDFLLGIGIYLTIELEDFLGFPLSPILIFGSIGISIISWGVYFLTRFFKQYPKIEKEA